MYSFTKDTATEILEALKSKGYSIDPGLSDEEVEAVETAFNTQLPPDFKLLLQTGVIRGHEHKEKPEQFPDWRNPEKEAERYQDRVEYAFIFDIAKSGYWTDGFGRKPADIDKALEQALTTVRTWPRLFPIFAHRFIPSQPHKAGNPVISVWQASDTVYYGANLIEYMNKEFQLNLDAGQSNPERIPVWGAAFDLVNVGQNLTDSERTRLKLGKMPVEIAEAHFHCAQHRDEILNSNMCGCFDCLQTFKPTEITDWLANGTCAICPKCGVDSVIGDKSGFPISKEFLTSMNEYWFSGRIPKSS